MSKGSSDLKNHAMVWLATLLMAGSFFVSDRLSSLLNPLSITFFRFFASALLLFPLLIIQPGWMSEIRRALPAGIVLGLFYALFFVCLFLALTMTTVINTSAIFTLTPLISVFLSFIFLRERIALYQLGIYLLGAAGASWIIFDGKLELILGVKLNSGDALFLLGTLSMSLYVLLVKVMYRGGRVSALVFCTFFGSSLWTLLAILIFDQPFDWQQLLNVEVFSDMAYLVLFATLATLYLYQRSTIAIGPRTVQAYVYLNPAVVALIALIGFQQALPLRILPGMAITTLATVIILRDSIKRKGTDKPTHFKR